MRVRFAYPNSNRNRNRDTCCERHGYSDSDCYSDSDRNACAHRHGYSYIYTHIYAYPETNAHPQVAAHTKVSPDTGAVRSPARKSKSCAVVRPVSNWTMASRCAVVMSAAPCAWPRVAPLA